MPRYSRRKGLGHARYIRTLFHKRGAWMAFIMNCQYQGEGLRLKYIGTAYLGQAVWSSDFQGIRSLDERPWKLE
jgi:hypothetical protein